MELELEPEYPKVEAVAKALASKLEWSKPDYPRLHPLNKYLNYKQ